MAKDQEEILENPQHPTPPPQAKRGIRAHMELGSKEREEWPRNTLSKDICNLKSGRNMLKMNMTSDHKFLKEMIVKINVLGALVRDCI